MCVGVWKERKIGRRNYWNDKEIKEKEEERRNCSEMQYTNTKAQHTPQSNPNQKQTNKTTNQNKIYAIQAAHTHTSKRRNKTKQKAKAIDEKGTGNHEKHTTQTFQGFWSNTVEIKRQTAVYLNPNMSAKNFELCFCLSPRENCRISRKDSVEMPSNL